MLGKEDPQAVDHQIPTSKFVNSLNFESPLQTLGILQQLEQQTVRFLSDTTRNFAKIFSLSLSSIFKWYGEDFEKGYNNTHSLEEFMLQYPEALNLTRVQQKALKEGDMKIQFLK